MASIRGGGATPFAKYIQVTSPTLPPGMVLADTPGFGAAEDSGEPGSHENALKAYLVDQVSQVFWVVLAEQFIGRREVGFYEKFLMEKCNDIVVTGSEDLNTNDKARFRQRLIRNASPAVTPIPFCFRVDGLPRA